MDGPGLVVRETDATYRVWRDPAMRGVGRTWDWVLATGGGVLPSPRLGLVWLPADEIQPTRLVDLERGEVLASFEVAEAQGVVTAAADGTAWVNGPTGDPHTVYARFHPGGEEGPDTLHATSHVPMRRFNAANNPAATPDTWAVWVTLDGEAWVQDDLATRRLPADADEWEEVKPLQTKDVFDPTLLGVGTAAGGGFAVGQAWRMQIDPGAVNGISRGASAPPFVVDAGELWPLETDATFGQAIPNGLLDLARQQYPRLWPAFLGVGPESWTDVQRYVSHPDGHLWVISDYWETGRTVTLLKHGD